MRYTGYLVVGWLLIVLQGELPRLLGSLGTHGFRPSLLVPLLVFLGITETNLSLCAGVAFLLGYILDVVSGSPIGLHTFTSVAVLVLVRTAGLRIATQRGISRALLAGVLATLSTVMVALLLVIYGRNSYRPRAILPLSIPHGIATAVTSPLVFWLARQVQSLLGGLVDPTRAVREGGAVVAMSERRTSDGDAAGSGRSS